MKCFINEKERESTGSTRFIELMLGEYDGECWHEDSIYMNAELWEKLKLTHLFREVVSEFDYYGINPISIDQWEAIRNIGCDVMQREAIDEVSSWIKNCFINHEYFTVLGL